MDGLLQVTGWGLLVAPVVGAVASGAGRSWGNLVTAAACAVWAGLVLFASGGLHGPLLGITAMLLGVVAIVEVALAVELRDRQRAGRRDGGIRAASAIIALLAPVIVIVFAVLAFIAWLDAIS